MERSSGRGYPHPIRPGETVVGWIGTGVMGSAMAGRILAAGYSLSVHTRTPSKSAALISAGARLASSPADASSGADVVFTMVGHPSELRSAVLDPSSGALSSLPAGAVLVDHTTSLPSLAREIAAAARSRDCWSVDAPVSGGDVGARNGTLSIFAGGEGAVIDWLGPLWEIMGRVTVMGPSGTGQSSKIGNQIVGAGSVMGLSEGIVFARAAGIDVGEFLAAIRGGAAGSAALEIWGDRVGDDLRPGRFGEYMSKDLGMALDEGGGGCGGEGSAPAVVLPGAAIWRQLFQAMAAGGDVEVPFGMVDLIQRIGGK